MNSSAVNWACYRHLLKHAIPGNPNITSVEGIDDAMTVFTLAMKSTKASPKHNIHIRVEIQPLQN
ncbi:hypothetical protein B7P43_G11727 [Cryptotermes secundus]|uniref:Uncharacterized protein n=1 Tax=Cryptotermes secundus TaxID=105785 RepID=A0A2J7R4Q2_9NEOP|nr:hypothetical protein B7P43_G11727 [Cryptotermes secundus]